MTGWSQRKMKMLAVQDADGTSALPHFYINRHDRSVTTINENTSKGQVSNLPLQQMENIP
ncbi:MAG: hypothetical protein C4527_29205 [Candidatus Omnitrophota bacterium]|nr:MAG: hypothetical protein C4527_29205 [Candidatus Omnitrophota bacterium]